MAVCPEENTTMELFKKKGRRLFACTLCACRIGFPCLLSFDCGHLPKLCPTDHKRGRYRTVTLPSLYRHITVTAPFQHRYNMLFYQCIYVFIACLSCPEAWTNHWRGRVSYPNGKNRSFGPLSMRGHLFSIEKLLVHLSNKLHEEPFILSSRKLVTEEP